MIEILAALFGLLIGSFLNVCIFRWPRDLSVVRPRSRCTQCARQIAWYDNIPVFSFLHLHGRCRHCGQAIHWRYPLVELLTAASFAVFAHQFGLTPAAARYCVFAAILIGLIFSDLDMLILPDELTLGGLALGLIFSSFTPTPGLPGFPVSGRLSSVINSAAGAALPALTLWLLGWSFEKVRHKEGLGLGDVKMIAMIGAFLGIYGTLLTVIGGSIAGSIVGLIWIRLTKKEASTYQLPFGTFLGSAAFVVALWNRQLLFQG